MAKDTIIMAVFHLAIASALAFFSAANLVDGKYGVAGFQGAICLLNVWSISSVVQRKLS